MSEQPEVIGDDLSWEELAPWLEFGCWTSLVLAPVLYYINGPSVSSDQAIVRTALVIIAAVGGVVLRFANRRRARRSQTTNDR
jgi:hypothetical protein